MKRVALKPSRKPIPRRSAKMEAKYAGPDGRRALVARLLSERPRCEYKQIVFECQQRSTEIHEVLSRARGGSILDESNCRALCHEHHRYITDHPLEAERLGLSKRRWPKEQGAV